MTYLARLAKIALIAFATPAAAHEFWIEPQDYAVAVGAEITADLKNGEDFKGARYPFIPETFSRFEIATRKGAGPVPGTRGDYPAVQLKTATGGLHVLAYAGTANDLTYTKYEKFENFVTGKDLDWVLEAHDARGLSRDRIREFYYRFAKSLVKVGSGAGRDRAFGLPFELVAETNPYVGAPEAVRLRLLENGAAKPDFEVQIWIWPEGAEKPTQTRLRTDATGRVSVPRGPGGEVLVNAVMAREPNAEEAAKGAEWVTDWATITYRLD